MSGLHGFDAVKAKHIDPQHVGVQKHPGCATDGCLDRSQTDSDALHYSQEGKCSIKKSRGEAELSSHAVALVIYLNKKLNVQS